MPPSRTRSPRPQFFAAAIEALMERNGVNQVQIAAATGIAVSRVNNYVHGNYRTIRPDHLEKLARAIARTARERGELIRGYLLDLLPEVLQNEIRLRGTGPGGRASGRIQPDWSRLPATTARALAGMQALSRRSAKARARVQWFFEILAEAHGP